MKRTIFFLVILLSMQLADSQQLIGTLGLVSEKIIDLKGSGNSEDSGTEIKVYGYFSVKTKNSNDNSFYSNYELLKQKEPITSEVLSSRRGASIQEAVNKTISSCRNGEILMNADIYSYENGYVVVGNVYGRKSEAGLFKTGDTVFWGKNNVGVIVSCEDEDECVVRNILTNKSKDVDFDDLTLAEPEMNKFSIGDRVGWRESKKSYKIGIIISITNNYVYLVKDLVTGELQEKLCIDLLLITE